jgi:hypothetical protein
MAPVVRRSVLIGFCLVVIVGLAVEVLSRPRVQILATEREKPYRETKKRNPISAGAVNRPRLDPAAWGQDHIGQPLPEYVDSGECLFCHRNDIGPSWTKNKHSQTIRDAFKDHPAVQALAANPAAAPLAAQVELILGDSRANRFLKRSAEFGHFDLLSAVAVPARGTRFRLQQADNPHWDSAIFARRCAGCHTTGIEPATQAFTTASLDCYVCHGDGPLEHANDTKLMPLARARRDSPAAVTSICAQCHIRAGRSKSSGLPYPNNFVAGDNLFKDFEVDWSLADNADLNPADRHVLDNVREVVLFGNEQLTCLSCHEVHQGTSLRHRELPDQAYCQHCHQPTKSKKEHKHYDVHSPLCGY